MLVRDFVLTSCHGDGKVVCSSTVIPILPESLATHEMKERMSLHSKSVASLIGNFSQSTLDKTDIRNDNAFTNLFESDSLDHDLIEPQEVNDLGNPTIRPDVDAPTNDATFKEQNNALVGLKVPIVRGGEVLEATVCKRKRVPDGSLLGIANANPMFDSRLYEVEFPDGSYQDYATNTLLENLFSHVDEEGMHHAILKV